jgi:hypothetical protein
MTAALTPSALNASFFGRISVPAGNSDGLGSSISMFALLYNVSVFTAIACNKIPNEVGIPELKVFLQSARCLND